MDKHTSTSVLILGVGNYLLGDEGVGIHALRHLEKTKFNRPVMLLDGGCGGLNLLSYFQDYPIVIIIDAACDDKPAGTVSVLEPRFAHDFPKSLGAHDIGLRDLIESAELIGSLPKIYLITISISEIQSMSTELSTQIKESFTKVVYFISQIFEIIEN